MSSLSLACTLSQGRGFDADGVEISSFPFRSAHFRELSQSEFNTLGDSLYYTRYDNSVCQDLMGGYLGGDISTSCVEATGSGSGSVSCPGSTPPTTDCEDDKTCVLCGSGDTDSECVHCASDTYGCNSKDCKFEGGSCVSGNGLMTATVPKDSKFFVTLSVTLPYTKDEFDQSKQDKYKTAVANAAGTVADNVEIVAITEARRRAGQVVVETKVRGAPSSALVSVTFVAPRLYSQTPLPFRKQGFQARLSFLAK